MKRLTLEATDENVLKALKNNEYNKNEDIKHFIEALDLLDGNAFISLDGKWGEGKTFYVQQIAMTLEYLRRNTMKYEDEKTTNMKETFKGTELENISINNTFFPIYYNAWLYDNHNDPLLSLVYNILKKTKEYWYSSEKSQSIKDKLSKLVSSVNVSIGNGIFNVGIDGEKFLNVFKKDDIFEEIKLAEELRELVKDIFNDIIVENGQRLVIFVDELDRCRPSFAIEMLERMKHYFDDESLIFITSVNKKQLVNTISKYYGQDFNSSGYLNKFFDFNINMPTLKKQSTLTTYRDGERIFYNVVNDLSEYFDLSLRDTIVYKQRCEQISGNFLFDFDVLGMMLSVCVPIIVLLDIVDQNEKRKFLVGDFECFDTWCLTIPGLKYVAEEFANARNRIDPDISLTSGINKIKDIYVFAFKGIKTVGYKDNEKLINCCSDLKSLSIKLSNGYK